MHHRALPLLLLLAIGCEGKLIDSNLPGSNQPPTTNAALAFRFGGSGSELIADLVTDPAGNLYLAGTFTGSPDFAPDSGVAVLNSLGGQDGFLAKYSSAGALVWVSGIGGSNPETVTSLARDGAGNLYVGGGFAGATDFDPGSGVQVLNSVGGEDGFVAKYSPSGALVWARRFGGPNADEVASLAADAAGNVYAVGSFSGQANALPTAGPTILSDGTPADGFVLALDPAGAVRWAIPVGGNQDDAAHAVALASTGNLVVAGTFHGSADFSRNGAPNRLVAQGGADAFLATYSSLGVLQWVRDIGGLGEETIAGGGLSLDAQDGAAVLGSFSGAVDFDPGPGTANRNSISGADLFVARYDVGGIFGSVLTVGGGQGTVRGVRLLADLDGSVLLTGWFSGAIDFDPGAGLHSITSLGVNGATDAYVARYSAAGSFLWVSRFGESTTVGDRSNSGGALALDPADKPLVAGRFFGSPDFDPGSSALRLTSLGAADAFVVKLTAAGALATTP
ncbi:MAG TPA: SBBP repeat-containing protein [Gemmatimonadales bacterium]|jgi:hypothetical protein|nr:SBBP repeat-containing protein [Gemmatimonadales bacterium]